MNASDSLAGPGQRALTAITRTAHRLTTTHTQLLVCSVLVAAAVLTRRLDQGWFPHDDGSLAQSADRVLAGELPHRDFADLYTGLLSFVNAAVFALAGEDIFNLRFPLFVLFLAFAGCFFALARRLVSPAWAFVATLFAIGWSVPVYPAPMPSWYLLFLSTFGMYGVVRFLEVDQRRWLLLAGACGGISIAIKVVGAWYVIAVLLVLLIRPLLDEVETQSYRRRPSRYGAIVITSALLALASAAAVFNGRPGASELVGLLIPVTALCGSVALLGWREWAHPYGGPAGQVIGDVAVFLASVAVPVVLVLAPYALTGSIGDLLEGVLIAPRSRYEFASLSMPHPATLLWAVPIIGLLYIRARVSESRRRLLDVAASSVIAFLLMTATDEWSYSAVWSTTRALAPFVTVLGAFAILRRGDVSAGIEPRVVALFVLVAGFSTLLQFPFAAPVYFCYVAPLLLLGAIAGLRRVGYANGLLPGVVLIALVAFGIRQLDHQSHFSLGFVYQDDPQVAILDSDRASVRVRPEDKRAYDRIQELVRQYRPIGRPIFAGPDAPEIYFLTGSWNPTPSLLDFLDRSGATRGDNLLGLLSREGIRVVVLNHEPLQSPRLEPQTIEHIRSMYGGEEWAGHFEVRWIDDPRHPASLAGRPGKSMLLDRFAR